MKRLVALLLLVLPVLAQDVDDTLKKARDLERKAGKLLDEGKRAQAFELLAQAAQLRDKARAAASRKADGSAGKKKAAKKTAKKAPARRAANEALKRMDAALMANDLKKTRRHAEEARRALGRWARELAAQEKRLANRGRNPLLERVESLEKQLAELRRMIRNPR